MGARSQLPIEPIEFTAGRRDVVVELASGGSLRAKVLTKARLFDHSLQLVLRPRSQLTRSPDGTRKLELTGRALIFVDRSRSRASRRYILA